MPHLHLPVEHTDADLVLAANLAEIVGSEDLYVAWCHETGPGAVPEVEAEVREPHARAGFFSIIGGWSGGRCSGGRRTTRSSTTATRIRRGGLPSVRTLTRSELQLRH